MINPFLCYTSEARIIIRDVYYYIYIFILTVNKYKYVYTGHTEYMRGCMADIIYNGANVIEYTKSRQGKSEASAVTWGCSKVFDATKKTEISFLEEGAFLSISRPISRTGSR